MSDKRAITSWKYWETVGHRQYLHDMQAHAKLFHGQYKAEIEAKEVIGTKPNPQSDNGTAENCTEYIPKNLDWDRSKCFYSWCNEESILQHKCEGCHDNYYCSEDHRRLDWENHKQLCQAKAFTYATFPNVVRQIPVARCDFGLTSMGFVVSEEEPLVVLPQIPVVGEFVVCIDCCRPILVARFAKCSKCFWPICRDACDPNVSLHTKDECNILELAKSTFHWKLRAGYECLWIIRILLQKKFNPQTYHLIRNTETREESLEQNEVEPGRYYAMEMIRCLYDMNEIDFSDKEIIHAWNLLRLNLIYSRTPANSIFKKAKMLYKEGWKFPHSCFANMVYETGINFKLRLCLQRPVSAGDALTLNYDPESIFQPTRSRQVRLMKFYKFRCHCIRCEDPTEFGTYYSGILCHSTDACEDSKNPGFLLQKDMTDVGSIWECFKCHQVQLTNTDVQSWLFSITRGLEACLKRQAEPEELRMFVENILEQKLLHESHHVVFEYFVETLKLLSKQLENDPSMGTNYHLMKYWRAARCVSKICRTFLPAEVNLLGPVLRMCVLIKLAGLVVSFQNKEYNLPRVKQDLERYVLRVEDNGRVAIRNGPLVISQEEPSTNLDSEIVHSLVNSIETFVLNVESDADSSKTTVIIDLQLYAKCLREHFPFCSES